VRNRSQQENDSLLPLHNARKVEADFLRGHAELRRLPSEQLGVQGLSERLVALQCQRIKATLPVVLRKLRDRVGVLQGELDEVGDLDVRFGFTAFVVLHSFPNFTPTPLVRTPA
jgi:hypothetical protein